MLPIDNRAFNLLWDAGVRNPHNQQVFDEYADLASQIPYYTQGVDTSQRFIDSMDKISTLSDGSVHQQ